MNALILALIAAVYFALFAYISARNEAAQVYQRISMGDRTDLDHSTLTLVRCVLVFFFIAGALLFAQPMDPIRTVLLALALGVQSYGMFAPVHRYIFNREFARHACYVSPGNKYDTWFMRRVVLPWPMYLRERYLSYYDDPRIREQIHQAGANAYRMEFTALFIAVVLFTIIHFVI